VKEVERRSQAIGATRESRGEEATDFLREEGASCGCFR